jgi:predicted nucleotidyltransferase
VDLEEIISRLKHEARTLATHAPSARWYLFGSVNRGVRAPTDVDLLIMYENDYEARELRKGLESFSRMLPLHLLLMRKDEEKELRFITEQRATKIFPDAN